LKSLVKSEIVNRFDHSLMVNKQVPQEQIELLRKTTDRILVVGFQPTTENIVRYIAEILREKWPAGVELFGIRLYETVTSFAEWFAGDNEK